MLCSRGRCIGDRQAQVAGGGGFLGLECTVGLDGGG